jgi:hypothetical protein
MMSPLCWWQKCQWHRIASMAHPIVLPLDLAAFVTMVTIGMTYSNRLKRWAIRKNGRFILHKLCYFQSGVRTCKALSSFTFITIIEKLWFILYGSLCFVPCFDLSRDLHDFFIQIQISNNQHVMSIDLIRFAVRFDLCFPRPRCTVNRDCTCWS